MGQHVGDSTSTPLSHINPKVLYECVKQGELVTLRSNAIASPCVRGGLRGVVQGFSNASRLRLLKWLACVSWGVVGKSLFATFTYPDACVDSALSRRRSHLSSLHRGIERVVGKRCPALWRWEWRPRQTGTRLGEFVPHLHMLYFGCRRVPFRYVRSLWGTILRYDLPIQIDIQACSSGEQAASYVAKYAAKPQVVPRLDNGAYLNTLGRHHGVLRRALVPLCPVESVVGDDPVVFERCRMASRKFGMNPIPRTSAGASFFGSLGREVFASFSEAGIAIDDETGNIIECGGR